MRPTRLAFLTAALAFGAAFLAPIRAHAAGNSHGEARERLGVQIISDVGDEAYQVVVRRGDRSAAVCTTPCRLTLPRGRYSAEAHSNTTDRTFVVRFDLRPGSPMRVRLATRDTLRHWTGVALAVVGVSAGAIAVDHWRYLALEGLGENTRTWAQQYVPTVQGDVAVATGVAFLPLAAVLLVPAMHLLSETRHNVVTERVSAPRWVRNRWPRLHLSSMRFDFVQGGGMVGASLTF